MLYMISAIVDTNGNDLGYRILDTSLIGKGNCTMDLSYTAVLNRLRTGGVIANLAVKNDKVVGTNGVIDRYSKVTQDNTCVSVPRLVVLSHTDDGFIVSDAFGKVSSLTNENILEINKKSPVANGKVVHKDGKEFISSIVGEYPYIERKKGTEVKTNKILILSNEDTVAQLVQKFEEHTKNKDIRIIGKLDFEHSSKLLGTLFANHGLRDFTDNKDEKALITGINYLKDVAIPDLAKICDKMAIMDYAKGVKEVTRGVRSADDASDLLVDLLDRIDSESVVLK